MEKEKIKLLKKQLRAAIADYISTEGCSCCRDSEGHDEAMGRIGKLLNMKKYSDKSGYDYSVYKTKK